MTNPDPHGISILSVSPDGASPASWAWKLVFTSVTLGLGFQRGEVTPLFFIGATLGHTLGVLGGVPVDLMAGLGFIAVLAGAGQHAAGLHGDGGGAVRRRLSAVFRPGLFCLLLLQRPSRDLSVAALRQQTRLARLVPTTRPDLARKPTPRASSLELCRNLILEV